jgi:hypothetical protein
MPITLAERSEAWTVFAPSSTGIMGSNPNQDMDVCLRLCCVCVVLYVGSSLETGWSPVQGVLPTEIGLRNWSETKHFRGALHSKVWAIGKRRERERQNSEQPNKSGSNQFKSSGETLTFYFVLLDEYVLCQLMVSVFEYEIYADL